MFIVLTLENAALPTAVNPREKVDVPVRTPVELLVAHEVPQLEALDDPEGVILLLPRNLTDHTISIVFGII